MIIFNPMKQWIEIYQYPGKKIVDHSKLKLWTFLRGQGECLIIIIILYIELSV